MMNATAPLHRGAATSQMVAELAGVSRPTVSQVLNGKAALFAPETVTRVLEAAQRLEYRPSVAGRALAKGRSDIIVIALPHVTFGPQLQTAIDAVGAALEAKGSAVLIHYASAGASGTDGLLHRMVPVAVADLGALDDRQRTALRARGTHVITMGGVATNQSAGEVQAAYLARRGHTRLHYALLDDAREDPYGPEHLVGFNQECQRKKLPEPRSVRIPLDVEAATTVLGRHLETSPVPDAFGCYNDDVAAVLIASAKRLGIDVPHDLSVMGIDDSLVAQVTAPRITTLAPDMQAAGQLIAARVLAALESSATEVRAPEVPTAFRVVERESVALHTRCHSI